MRFLWSSYVFGYIPTFLLLVDFCASMDSLNQTQLMSDGDTLISTRRKFQLGFFSTDNSSKRYLGIWFYNIPNSPIVWVANRDKPLEGLSGVLKIEHGNLVIQDNSSRTVWSSPSGTRNLSSSNVVANLLDSGNLVLKDENLGSYLWQSFDDPTDTMLAGAKLGWDFKVGMEWYLTSWKSAEDPFQGQFSYRIDPRGFPQYKLFEGNITRYRSSPLFSRTLSSLDLVYNSTIVYGSQEVYASHSLYDQNTLSRYLLNYTGKIQHLIWNNQILDWMTLYELPSDTCDEYAKCGPNAVCVRMNSIRTCKCLPGYVSKLAQDSDMFNIWYSGGCTRKSSFNCTILEAFKKVKRVKLPDLLQFELKVSMTHKECETMCLRNCTCSAYAIINDSRDGIVCGFWFGDLLDIREINDGINGYKEFFVRVVPMETEGNSTRKMWVVAIVAASLVFSVIFIWTSCMRIKCQGTGYDVDAGKVEHFESPIFDDTVILQATNNYSDSNKIGEGGFGPVYKGQLPDGQEIAVKKLSKFSRQGVSEFKNEVLLISKLQHRNLVKLLGYCMHGEERMLVYEYMPNGSLDTFIFGKARGNCLVWRKRFDIIVGVARGLLYLHRDSRLTIIHRDLKASNVLLDNKMNPKISDFGVARTFEEDQFSEKTEMIAGTVGYMSPEYAIEGLLSVKSDVFSFGVLVLEIVTGRSNRKFHHPNHSCNLLGHAWKQWISGKAHDLMDASMDDSFPISEVMRCIQIGLLCVQKHPEDRPTMSAVLLMLDSESATLPHPKEPGFYTERSSVDRTNVVTTVREYCSNDISSTLLDGR